MHDPIIIVAVDLGHWCPHLLLAPVVRQTIPLLTPMDRLLRYVNLTVHMFMLTPIAAARLEQNFPIPLVFPVDIESRYDLVQMMTLFLSEGAEDQRKLTFIIGLTHPALGQEFQLLLLRTLGLNR